MSTRGKDGQTEGQSVRSTDLPTFDLPTIGRLLAVDWGTKRIGLAISDPSQHIAQPLATLTRRAGKRFPMRQFRKHLEEHQPTGIVVGLPLSGEGGETPATDAVRALGHLIATVTGLPVALYDERMTTARALGAMRELGGRRRGREGDVDQLAAVVLLQTYLDARRR